ncbi:MAG: hypothetical protein IKX36_03030 [Prevotella sp.]|nr:hypothetical protein [Prevotella sp.]
MDTENYYQIKHEILDTPICYRMVEAKEIVALGENHYSVGNATFEVSSNVAKEIDRFAGIKRGQTQIAHDSYGEQGVTNLRNFFGQAEGKKGKHLVLAANTQSKQIVEAIPIKDSMITPDVFFGFAEMFMDKNQYLPEQVEYATHENNGISILLRPVKEQFMEYAPGDEFLSNGLYMKWNPGEINMGNYYERLVCLNGATQMSYHSITRANSPDVATMERLLNVTSDSALLKSNTETMLLSARTAMRTTASVRELGAAVQLLNKHGMSPEEANVIIPYEQTKDKYARAGYPTDSQHMAQAKSESTVWELFNMLTYFATHNQLWRNQDIRRTSLMESSVSLLMRERDIKEYYNIF